MEESVEERKGSLSKKVGSKTQFACELSSRATVNCEESVALLPQPPKI